MKIVYTGTLADGVLHDCLTRRDFPFKRGEAIEIPEAFAPYALANKDWQQDNAATKALPFVPLASPTIK